MRSVLGTQRKPRNPKAPFVVFEHGPLRESPCGILRPDGSRPVGCGIHVQATPRSRLRCFGLAHYSRLSLSGGIHELRRARWRFGLHHRLQRRQNVRGHGSPGSSFHGRRSRSHRSPRSIGNGLVRGSRSGLRSGRSELLPGMHGRNASVPPQRSPLHQRGSMKRQLFHEPQT
jgi:hypothetical protein